MLFSHSEESPKNRHSHVARSSLSKLKVTHERWEKLCARLLPIYSHIHTGVLCARRALTDYSANVTGRKLYSYERRAHESLPPPPPPTTLLPPSLYNHCCCCHRNCRRSSRYVTSSPPRVCSYTLSIRAIAAAERPIDAWERDGKRGKARKLERERDV